MQSSVTQKSDYTFKANRNLGRHGWLRLTPAYSVKLVGEILKSASKTDLILDPFSGTTTTGLVASEQGYQAIALDINPFLIWFGKLKCKHYTQKHLQNLKDRTNQALIVYETLIDEEHWIPSLFNIERWWSTQTLHYISALRSSLVIEFGEPQETQSDGLVWIAFCRLVIETSSAAFNHVSMSFQPSTNHFDSKYIKDLFLEIVEFIFNTAASQLSGTTRILQADARELYAWDNLQVNRVITSPPYPNRMSYIRELRPYMYWTKFLTEAREAGELDWSAIGGTWGIATSRLQSWQPHASDLPPHLFAVVNAIENSEGKNAYLLSKYVLKYFHDMHLHLKSLRSVLQDQAQIFYVVGNSTFFGCMVDTASLLATSMQGLGYINICSDVIRKRNCKKALYEYRLSATWRTS